MAGVDDMGSLSKGHVFLKKTFHKPTYCHHCSDLLWGLIQQGYICEVCNFIIHDRCLKSIITCCSSIIASQIKNPVAHCWSDQGHFKRKFCSVCRKRLDDSWAINCAICEYYAHTECQEFAIPNCLECATYVPERKLENVVHYHHWREGNLPNNSKCFVCRKSCWSFECLTGYRCEWCGITVHSGCFHSVSEICHFGFLEPIMLPSTSVSIPRTEIPMEAILVMQNRRKNIMSHKLARSISDDFSSSDFKYHNEEPVKDKNKDKDERDEVEVIKVFDGNCSLRRRIFRTITVSKNASYQALLLAALKVFYIKKDLNNFYLSDAYTEDEVIVNDPLPVHMLSRKEGKRPAVFLRFKDENNDNGSIDIYPGKLNLIDVHCTVKVTSETTVSTVIDIALQKFGLHDDPCNYQLYEVSLDKGVERLMLLDEQPWELLKQISKDSIRQMDLTRFYLHNKQDPHGTTIAIFVGNLPVNLSQRQYEQILVDFLGRVRPLLVFVNVKSGGCQGLELINSFRKLLNPHQVYDLESGGPLPGLYVFRHIKNYRILVCGGDGTIGWVLQCLDNVGQDSECSCPPCAIVPLGTGNDLARVLNWGTGYTGGEDPLSLLRDIIDAQEIRLDRWTVVFHTDEKMEDRTLPSNIMLHQGKSNEDNTQIFVMNNYFGIGIDADLCLDFHNAREENPNKFNSRLHNKGVYLKMGLRKMVSRKMCKDLHKIIRVEVDGRHIELPPLEGIIILNILSWGSGANPWGPEKEDNFNKPNHWDGMLEIVGVTGVVHLGQIQSGLRSALRIAQGGHIKIKLLAELPIQVDGEPWIQPIGDVVVLKSALKATMLKKIKSKSMKRRNTELYMTFGTAMTSVTTDNTNMIAVKD